MRVTYRLEREDYFNFDINQMRNIPKINKGINVQRFFIPSIFTIFILLFVGLTKNDVKTILPLYIVIVLIWVIMYPRLLMKSTHKRLSKTLDGKDDDYFDFSTIEVRPDGVYKIEKDEAGEEKALFVTEKISAINQDENYLYVFLPVGSFYVIPLKYFKSEDHKTRFIDDIKKLIA